MSSADYQALPRAKRIFLVERACEVATFIRHARRLAGECAGMVALVIGYRLALFDTMAEAMKAGESQALTSNFYVCTVPTAEDANGLWSTLRREGYDPAHLQPEDLLRWMGLKSMGEWERERQQQPRG
jgi:hypothetical protein